MSDNTHTSSFKIQSPYLSSHDLRELIGTTRKKKDTSKQQEFQIKNLKQILSNINQSYRPSAEIHIDSLIYNNIEVSDFESQIDFNTLGAIRIEETNLKYIQGKIDLMLEGGVENPEGLPVKISMNIADIELEKLVEDLEYLNNEDLRNTKRIDGDLDLEIDLTGIMNDDGSVDINSLNGFIKMDLRNLAIYEFDPITESVVLLKEERFEKLQFRPIRQTIEVTNGMIKIPRTEIQSTALHLFVEGESKIGEYHNLWISLPWNNILKKRDGTQLPEKLSFDESGAKFYIQIVQDKESEKEKNRKLRTKFRLGNKKLRKSNEN
nr:AsmA-like C-terminal region-containing protein [Christiangramia lutea]